MTTTAPAKPPKLDVSRLGKEERNDVTRRLRACRTDESRLRLASRIVHEAERAAPKEMRDRRDAAALSLALYDGVKAMDGVIGLSRPFFHEKKQRALGITAEEKGVWLKEASRDDVARRAAEHNVEYVEDALAEAVNLAEAIVRADARAEVARRFRDDAIVALLAGDEWDRSKVAKVMGVDDSRVSQIMSDRKA